MKVPIEKLKKYSIKMENFKLKWRFTNSLWNKLPERNVHQIIPLSNIGANEISKIIKKEKTSLNIPFTHDYFRVIDKAKILSNNEKIIENWLLARAISPQQEIILYWDDETAVITNWKTFVEYFDDFFYGGSDDLEVFSETLDWMLLCFHEDELYFGSNDPFEPSNQFKKHTFCY